MFKNDLLLNKQILITGAGSGLGLEMAKYFSSLGAKLIICGRDQEKLKLAASQIAEGTRYYALDIRDDQAVKEMFNDIWSKPEGLDVLVNNAAGNFLCASEDLTPNAFSSVVDIVLKGTFHCTLFAGQKFIENKRSANILNIISTYTETGSAFILPSACAKAGVYAMTTSLAFEWAEYNIRVNGIAPGPIPTKGAWKRLMPDSNFEDQYKKMMPLKRFGEPKELAQLAAFMVSPLASYLSGEIIALDGAERLRGGQFNFLSDLQERSKLKDTFRAMRKS